MAVTAVIGAALAVAGAGAAHAGDAVLRQRAAADAGSGHDLAVRVRPSTTITAIAAAVAQQRLLRLLTDRLEIPRSAHDSPCGATAPLIALKVAVINSAHGNLSRKATRYRRQHRRQV